MTRQCEKCQELGMLAIAEADTEEELDEIMRKHDLANAHVKPRLRRDAPVYEFLCAAGHMGHFDNSDDRDIQAKVHIGHEP